MVTCEQTAMFLFYRSITKIDKITGSTVQFMSDHPEFGRLDSLDIYADEIRDSKSRITKNILLFLYKYYLY